MTRSCIIVFDQRVDANELASVVSRCSPRTVFLAPLTSDRRVIDAVTAGIASDRDRTVSLLPLARHIDRAFGKLREDLVRWVVETGVGSEHVTGTARQIQPPGAPVSGWWFSSIAERNPLTSPMWLQVAQVMAVCELMEELKTDRVIVGVSPEGLSASLAKAVEARGSALDLLGSPFSLASHSQVAALEPLKSMVEMARTTGRVIRARRQLGAAQPFRKSATIFVSYFPALEPGWKEGSCLTRYFARVEAMLMESHRSLGWALLFEPFDGMSFVEGLKLAGDLQTRGWPAYLTEQYLGTSEIVRAWRSWCRHSMLVRSEWKSLRQHILERVPVSEARPVVEKFVPKAMLGVRTFQGFVFFEVFRALLQLNQTGRFCLFPAEFQPWEAALAAASGTIDGGPKLIGFQHTMVPPNLLNYSLDGRESRREPRDGGRPVPDLLVANGSAGLARLSAGSECSVTQAEAIRHHHVKSSDDGIDWDARARRVIVATSISRSETRALLSLLAGAAPELEDVEVVLKGHPARPIKEILRDLSFDLPASWRESNESIWALLRTSRVAVVLSTSVGLEALLAGCSVVRPLFPEVLSTSPIDDLDSCCCKVQSGPELAQAVIDGLDRPADRSAREKVVRYWNLDETLDGWRSILQVGDPI